MHLYGEFETRIRRKQTHILHTFGALQYVSGSCTYSSRGVEAGSSVVFPSPFANCDSSERKARKNPCREHYSVQVIGRPAMEAMVGLTRAEEVTTAASARGMGLASKCTHVPRTLLR